MVIDALRADLVANGSIPFLSRMDELGHLRAFVALADPPTVTLPRVKVGSVCAPASVSLDVEPFLIHICFQVCRFCLNKTNEAWSVKTANVVESISMVSAFSSVLLGPRVLRCYFTGAYVTTFGYFQGLYTGIVGLCWVRHGILPLEIGSDSSFIFGITSFKIMFSIS